MPVVIPEVEPTELIAGDTVKWKRLLSDYKASDGWSLTYAVRGPQVIDITSTADADKHSIVVASTVTSTWMPGNYWWDAYVTKSDERYTVASGKITIKANLSARAGKHDGRVHAEIMIEKIEAVLEKRAGKDVMDYEIGGVKLSKTPIPDLLQLYDYYRSKLKKNKKILMRFK